jgi:hypothetical protein
VVAVVAVKVFIVPFLHYRVQVRLEEEVKRVPHIQLRSQITMDYKISSDIFMKRRTNPIGSVP